jgi:hypothetical protein
MDQSLGYPVSDWLGPLEEHLEKEMNRWHFLEKVEAVEAPRLASLSGADASLGGADAEVSLVVPARVDAELQALAAMRDRWDDLVGHLAMLVRYHGLWRDMGFASFAHYCIERLGMSVRAVEQRAWLARRLYHLPSLRKAMQQGRVSYEKARILAADCLDDDVVEKRIEWASGKTCIELRRAAEAVEDQQMRADGALRLRIPRRVDGLLLASFRAARKVAGRWLTPGECLGRVAEHFIDTWKDLPKGRSSPERRAVERDTGLCQVPGCSRAAVHAHHVLYRARGGGDEPENLVALCAAHHLHGVHRGFVRVTGRAPDALVWELGERLPAEVADAMAEA